MFLFVGFDEFLHPFRHVVKDAVPVGLRTRVVYEFSCASCNACYVGETSRHFSTRVRGDLLSDRSSNVLKHLQSSEFCKASCAPDCFEILDSAATRYQVKLKESMFIKWEKPDLNQQVKHINLTLSLEGTKRHSFKIFVLFCFDLIRNIDNAM